MLHRMPPQTIEKKSRVFSAALLSAQKKRHAHACRFFLIGERLFCSCALEGDARKDNARLGTLDAVIRAVVAGSGIAADDARVIQLLHRRVASEVACHIGVGAATDCRIFLCGEDVGKDDRHIAARDICVIILELIRLDNAVCDAVVDIRIIPGLCACGVDLIAGVDGVDIGRRSQCLRHGEGHIGRELRRARTVGKADAVCIAHIDVEPCICRYIGEIILVVARERELALGLIDLAECVNLLTDRRGVEVDGVDRIGICGMLRAAADHNAVLGGRVGLDISKSAALRISALVGVIADPALPVGVGDIGCVAAAVDLIRLGEDRRGKLLPAAHQQRVAAEVFHLSELILGRPVAATGVDDENRAVRAIYRRAALDNLRISLARGRIVGCTAHLPLIIGFADDGGLADQRPGIGHLDDVDGLIEVGSVAAVLGDVHQIKLTAYLDVGLPGCPGIIEAGNVLCLDSLRDIDLAGDRIAPSAEQIVAVQALDDIHAVIGVGTVIARDVAVPAAVACADFLIRIVMDLRRPEVLRPRLAFLRLVNGLIGCVRQIADVGRFIQVKSRSMRCDVVVVAVMEEQPRVRAVGANRIPERHRAGDIGIQRNAVACAQRAGHRPAVHALRADDVGDVAEFAAVQHDIKAALQRTDVVERSGNRAVRRAAVERQLDIAVNNLLGLVNGRAVDAG